MNQAQKRYVFGPVPSRRLGRSLGVDLVPYKTCTYDCVYCQIGRTTDKRVERGSWAPKDLVIEQIKTGCGGPAPPDVITFAGSGEPTLSLDLGDIIRSVKSFTDVPVTVLTNGSLLHLPEVREELMAADVVVPNLDAGSDEVFRAINRPHPGVVFESMVQGLIEFGKTYQGKLLLEVFMVGGVNDGEAEMRRISDLAGKIEGAVVQLNTVTRPPAEESARKTPRDLLDGFARTFSPPAEVIADYHEKGQGGKGSAAREEDVLETVSRRPCTLEDVASGLGVHRNEAVKYLEKLMAKGKIETQRTDGRLYYALCRQDVKGH